MPNSGARALTDVAALVRGQGASSTDQTLAAVADALARLVPADLVAWNDVDLDTWRSDVRSFTAGLRPDQEAVDRLLETVGDNPMVMSYVRPDRVHDVAPRRLSDVIGDNELHRTRAYKAVYKPLGGDRQATVLSSRTTDQHGRVWGFNRTAADFTDTEMHLLRSIQPFLAIIDHLMDTPGPPLASAASAWGLTDRETEIVSLMARGLTAGAIASLCGISSRTVQKHLEHAYAKLGCHDKVTAVLRFSGAT